MEPFTIIAMATLAAAAASESGAPCLPELSDVSRALLKWDGAVGPYHQDEEEGVDGRLAPTGGGRIFVHGSHEATKHLPVIHVDWEQGSELASFKHDGSMLDYERAGALADAMILMLNQGNPDLESAIPDVELLPSTLNLHFIGDNGGPYGFQYALIPPEDEQDLVALLKEKDPSVVNIPGAYASQGPGFLSLGRLVDKARWGVRGKSEADLKSVYDDRDVISRALLERSKVYWRFLAEDFIAFVAALKAGHKPC